MFRGREALLPEKESFSPVYPQMFSKDVITEQPYSGSMLPISETQSLGAIGGQPIEQSRHGYENPLFDAHEGTQFGPQMIDAETQHTVFWGLSDMEKYPNGPENVNQFGIENIHYPNRMDAQLQTPNVTDLGAFRNVRGIYGYPKNLKEDLKELAKNGIIIDLNANLGTGSSKAKIYRGQYLGINKRFAVKVFVFDDPNEARYKVETEKVIMHSIDHKYCVNLQNVINMGDLRSLTDKRVVTEQHGVRYENFQYTSSDRIYIFMDFADLGPLNKYFKSYPKFHSSQLRAANYQLLEALKYLYSKGISHGDLHAGNVLMFGERDVIDFDTLGIGHSAIGQITVNFRAKLADFGVSESNNDLSFDLKTMSTNIFTRIFYHNTRFDNKSDTVMYKGLIDKMYASSDVHSLYQSMEMKMWFAIQ